MQIEEAEVKTIKLSYYNSTTAPLVQQNTNSESEGSRSQGRGGSLLSYVQPRSQRRTQLNKGHGQRKFSGEHIRCNVCSLESRVFASVLDKVADKGSVLKAGATHVSFVFIPLLSRPRW